MAGLGSAKRTALVSGSVPPVNWIALGFPHLESEGFRPTSPQSHSYNCIAWAAGDSGRWWWPDEFGVCYWPSGVPRSATPLAFIAAFGTLGYKLCDDGKVETGVEKIAFYTGSNGNVTYGARQLPTGKWTSKLGKNIDCEHSLRGLEGSAYGRVYMFMSKRSSA